MAFELGVDASNGVRAITTRQKRRVGRGIWKESEKCQCPIKHAQDMASILKRKRKKRAKKED